MLFSRKDAVLEQLSAVQIHGAPFYDIVYRYAEPPDSRAEQARVPGELIYPNAQAGDRVFIEKIANTVMRVEKL